MSSRARGGTGRLAVALLAASTLLAAPAPSPAQQDTARHDTAAAADTAPSGPVYLRLSPRPELSLTYAHRIRARMEAPEELGGGQSLESRMRMRRTPVAVGADSLDLRIEILDIALSSEDIPEGQLPDLTRHEGTTFLARMTTRGELVRLDRTREDPRVRGAGGISPVQRSVRMSGFPALPEDPVRPGDTWVDTTRVHTGVMQGMGEGTTLAVSRTTLERISRQGQTRVAELSVVSTYTFRPADSAGAGGRRANMSGSGSATVRFDLGAGRYLHSESSQDYTVNLGLPGADRTFSVRFHVESEAQLVEVTKPEGEDGSGNGRRR